MTVHAVMQELSLALRGESCVTGEEVEEHLVDCQNCFRYSED